jgi:hypothetical protein
MYRNSIKRAALALSSIFACSAVASLPILFLYIVGVLYPETQKIVFVGMVLAFALLCIASVRVACRLSLARSRRDRKNETGIEE